MNIARHARGRSYHTLREPLIRETGRTRHPEFSGSRSSAVGARRPAEPKPPRRFANRLRRFFIPLAAIGLAAGSMTALAARERVAAMVPFAAPAYAALGLPVNLHGLAIQDVSAHLGAAGEKKFLVIEGWIVNLRATQTTSPDLRIALRGSDGEELYVWTTRSPKRRLEHAERVKFAARLEAPPEAANDAIVRFVDAGSKPGAEGS